MRYLTVVVMLFLCATAWAGETVQITDANDNVESLRLSGDGRFAAYITAADNIVPGDTNGTFGDDVFVKDLAAGTTARVSLCADGSQLNAPVFSMAISRNGDYLAFVSNADVFTPSGPPLALQALYFTELPSGPVEAVIYFPDHGPVPSYHKVNSVSADGRYICFLTSLGEGLLDPRDNDGPYAVDLYVYDREADTFILVDVNDAGEKGSVWQWIADGPMMTPDGRYVVFASEATNLVPGDTNGIPDAFLRDLQDGTTTRVSVRNDGTQIPPPGNAILPVISADGRYVMFSSIASVTGLPDTGIGETYMRDLLLGTTTLISMAGGVAADGSCSGSFVSSGETPTAFFQGDPTNLVPGVTTGDNLVYQRDLTHGVTDIVSCTSDGAIFFHVDSGQYCPNEAGDLVAFVSASPTGALRSLATAPAQAYLRVRGPFWDVPSRFWAVTQIEACYQAGIVGGYPGGAYLPSLPVTRDQMAVFISRALAGSDAAIPAGPPTPTFSDVPTDYWAYRHVEYAAAHGVVGGYSDGYRPLVPVTRDQMAVFVARGMCGGESAVPTGPPTGSFTDVPAGFWAYKHIEHAKAEGVVGGYPDGLYHPEITVTRDQMAVFVKRGFLPL